LFISCLYFSNGKEVLQKQLKLNYVENLANEKEIVEIIFYLCFFIVIVTLVIFFYFSRKKIIQKELEKKDLEIQYQKEL
jgi:hypothetical protein